MKSLVHTLNDAPHNLHAIEFSIDDLYLSHDEQVELAASCPDNPLIQHRGQPSTHSVEIGVDLFAAILRKDKDIKVPAYDKSCFAGAGDRMPQHEWQILNREGEQTVEVVIFEGWCVGFRALSIEEVIHKWKAARALFLEGGHAYRGRLGRSELKHVLFVNDKLKAYDALTS